MEVGMNATVDVSGWSVREVILELLGVEPAVGPLACWCSHEIHAAMRAVRDRLSALAGSDLEQWWSAATDTARGDLIAQVEVPAVALARRPWANTRVLWGTRIPYIPIAAFLHAMAAGGHPTVGATADTYGITEATSPWQLLEILDRSIEPAPVPDDHLAQVAGGLRLALNNQPDDETAVHNPARWLLSNHHAASWDVLAAVAATATAEENERQNRLRADRAAKEAAS
jgi:hypothetical protein